ncbi:MAG: response regulator transcription factor [Eubacterium sp.]|nr:response regulator transcription factor [Eubacterium sp.]
MKGINKNILVIEDNEYYMNLICTELEQLTDVNIYRAINSAEAYRYAMEISIDVFIVDIILNTNALGDVSGIKFIERIRTINKYKFAPIIITTSLEDPKLHSYSYLHCYRYFEKKYDPKELFETVREVLQYETPNESTKMIYYKREGLLFSINTEDIIFIVNCNRYIEYHCIDGVHKAPYKSCKKIIEDIHSEDFLQCNRHTVVNRKYILYLDTVNRYIQLLNDYGSLEIGPRMKKDLMSRLRYD